VDGANDLAVVTGECLDATLCGVRATASERRSSRQLRDRVLMKHVRKWRALFHAAQDTALR
jgi:hypothetical protein